MARGWESKSVEDQQSEATQIVSSDRPKLSPQENIERRRRDGILLSRRRIAQQLLTVKHPEHRALLQRTLEDLDRQLPP